MRHLLLVLLTALAAATASYAQVVANPDGSRTITMTLPPRVWRLVLLAHAREERAQPDETPDAPGAWLSEILSERVNASARRALRELELYERQNRSLDDALASYQSMPVSTAP